MLTTKDIAWAAGFLEGEGSFTNHGTTIRVSAGQVQREPLERLQKMFGGKIALRKRKQGGGRWADIHFWYLYGVNAAGLTMTLLCLLSPRRFQQAIAALDKWKTGVGCGGRQRAKTHCPQGHPYDAENTRISKRGRICRACTREASRRRYRASVVAQGV